jgi:MraZ protein
VYGVQGQYHCSLDAKGRLSLPAKLKEALRGRGEESLVIAFFDGGLQGYPTAYWGRLERKISRQSLFSRKARSFVLGFMAGANEVGVDKLGRVLIPQHLRDRAGLDREAVVLSFLSQIEIWDRARFEERQLAEADAMNIDDFADALSVPLDDDEEG